MVSGTNKGGIVAREGFSSSSMGVSEVKNNYWLDTCGVTYGRGSMNNNEQAEVKTSQGLKQLANGLGEEYTSDIQNENGTWKYNEGYPVLKWQLENDKTLT